MVDHLTTVMPDASLGQARQAEMAAVLEAIGFTLQRHGRRIAFSSSTVEAQTAKAYLRAHGFLDREFGIVLEYTRQWGVM